MFLQSSFSSRPPTGLVLAGMGILSLLLTVAPARADNFCGSTDIGTARIRFVDVLALSFNDFSYDCEAQGKHLRIDRSIFDGSGDLDRVGFWSTCHDSELENALIVGGADSVQVYSSVTADPQLQPNGRPNDPGSPAINSGSITVPGALPAVDLEGGPRLLGSAPDRGAFETSVAALPFHQTLPRPVAQPGERFGAAMAMSATIALVAAPGRDLVVSATPTPDAGAVEVFAGDAAGWSHQQTLTAPVPETGRSFGIAVARADMRVAIASLYRYDLYERSSATQPFTHVHGTAFSPLGGIRPDAAVALDGDRLAYGFGSSAGAGRVHIYQRGADGWQAQGTLFADAPDGGDYFGSALAFNGDQLLVGAPNEDLPAAAAAGVVYVFQLGPGAPVLVEKIESFVVRAHAGFGQRLVSNDNHLLVGAPNEQLTLAAPNAGTAYLYQRGASGDWQFEQRLVAPDFRANAYFGSALALEGDTLAVGAPGHDLDFAQFMFLRAGRVYAYRRSNSGWLLADLLNLSLASLDDDDNYGAALALAPDWLVIGASAEETDAVADAGQAMVHVRPILRDGFELTP